MKRDIWVASKSFVNGVQCLNALFCEDGEGDLSEKDRKDMEEYVASHLSYMQIEDAIEVLKSALNINKPY